MGPGVSGWSSSRTSRSTVETRSSRLSSPARSSSCLRSRSRMVSRWSRLTNDGSAIEVTGAVKIYPKRGTGSLHPVSASKTNDTIREPVPFFGQPLSCCACKRRHRRKADRKVSRRLAWKRIGLSWRGCSDCSEFSGCLESFEWGEMEWASVEIGGEFP